MGSKLSNTKRTVYKYWYSQERHRKRTIISQYEPSLQNWKLVRNPFVKFQWANWERNECAWHGYHTSCKWMKSQSVEYNPLFHGTIVKIIHEELKMSKVSARWVPKLLTDVRTASRISSTTEFLTIYHQEGKGLFTQIMTDEKWVYHYTPEMEQGINEVETKGRTDNSESEVKTISRQISSILGCGRYVIGGICGRGSDCEPKNLIRYTHPTVASNEDKVTWQIV